MGRGGRAGATFSSFPAPPAQSASVTAPDAAEVLKRARDEAELKKAKEERRKAPAAADVAATTAPAATPARAKVQETPIAFLFPGQGSQAVGMLKVSRRAGLRAGEEPLWLAAATPHTDLCLPPALISLAAEPEPLIYKCAILLRLCTNAQC